MLRILSIIIIIFFILACSSNNRDKNDNYCNCDDLQLDLSYNHFFLENKTKPYSGYCLRKDKKGNVIERINYSKGKVNGTLTNYFENGQIETERDFEKNMQQGEMKQWDIEGNLLFHCIFERGKLDTVLIDNR